jgi:Flp pilus assembly protein TadG
MALHPERKTWLCSWHRALQGNRLSRSRDGNVIVLFAFLSVPMLMFSGAAIDYGFATRLETKLQAATDSTALLLCQTALTTTTVDLNTLAQTAMKGAMGATNLMVDPLTITSNPRQITLTAHKQSTTFFGKLTGTVRINPGATSQCATPLPKTFEIALVLDNTGSMSASSGTQSKMQAVQQAATNFVNYVNTNSSFSSATRISIVPFAGAVAVDPTAYRFANWIDQYGQSSYHWTNVISPSAAGFDSRFDIFTKLQRFYSSWGWSGCLETLPYPLNVQDNYPTSSNKDSFYVPLFAPDEPGDASSGPNTFPTGSRNPTAISYNSYIDDDGGSNCNNSTNFNTALGQACKYATPTNATSGPTAGIPNGPNFGCTTQPLLRLTNSTSVLKSAINNMAPLGATNIHEGLMWGWRTLSPINVFKDDGQAAYATTSDNSDTTAVNKIIILMTDGENSWTANPNAPTGSLYFASGYFQNANQTTVKTKTPNTRLPSGNQNVRDAGTSRNALDALTKEACDNIKAVNITVFTIGFSVPSDPIDSAGQALLQKCASSSDKYFLANTSDDLLKAFDQIQKSIGRLRITR